MKCLLKKDHTYIIYNRIHVCKRVLVVTMDLKCMSLALKIKLPFIIYPAPN